MRLMGLYIVIFFLLLITGFPKATGTDTPPSGGAGTNGTGGVNPQRNETVFKNGTVPGVPNNSSQLNNSTGIHESVDNQTGQQLKINSSDTDNDNSEDQENNVTSILTGTGNDNTNQSTTSEEENDSKSIKTTNSSSPDDHSEKNETNDANENGQVPSDVRAKPDGTDDGSTGTLVYETTTEFFSEDETNETLTARISNDNDGGGVPSDTPAEIIDPGHSTTHSEDDEGEGHHEDPEFEEEDITDDEKPKGNEQDLTGVKEVQHKKDDKDTSTGNEEDNNRKLEEPTEGRRGHFFGFILFAMFLTMALYILYHNKRKIVAWAFPGSQRRTGMRHRGGYKANYERLENKGDGKTYAF